MHAKNWGLAHVALTGRIVFRGQLAESALLLLGIMQSS